MLLTILPERKRICAVIITWIEKRTKFNDAEECPNEFSYNSLRNLRTILWAESLIKAKIVSRGTLKDLQKKAVLFARQQFLPKTNIFV